MEDSNENVLSNIVPNSIGTAHILELIDSVAYKPIKKEMNLK
jgi:hypothetical protein